MNEKSKSRILLALFAGFGLAATSCSPGGAEPPLKGAAIGGPFTLVNQDGRQVSEADFKGKYRIVYFGFTHCPDVCPTDLVQIGQGLKTFEKKDPARAAKVQPIFVTVDPERDTPAVMKQFVPAFHPRLIGLTGSPQQIENVKKTFAVYGSKEQSKDGAYAVNHSRTATLFGPGGEPIALLSQDEGAEAVAEELDRWVK